jgi:hypothetical protein
MLEKETKEKEELKKKIEKEQKALNETLQAKLIQLQKEKVVLQMESEKKEEQMVNKMLAIIERIANEKWYIDQ